MSVSAAERTGRGLLGRTISAGALLAAVAAALPAPALADVALPERTSDTRIQTTRPDFSDASITILATSIVGEGSTGSRQLDFYSIPDLTSYQFTTRGAVDVTDAALGDYNEVTATVTAAGGGSFTIEERGDAAPSFLDASVLYRYADGREFAGQYYPYLPRITQLDLPVLELYLPLGGAGLVDQGGVFRIAFEIPGDYSTTAGLDSGTGQHLLYTFDDQNWRIEQDFVYDANADLTRFSAVNTDYQYGSADGSIPDQSPNLDVYFFGAAAAGVPEPAAWTTMIAGLGAVGALLRFRPRRRAAA